MDKARIGVHLLVELERVLISSCNSVSSTSQKVSMVFSGVFTRKGCNNSFSQVNYVNYHQDA